MGILPSKLPFSRKHHVSSRTQVGACSRVRQASRNFNLFSDYSNIAHRSETHRKASKGRLNCSEGRGQGFESLRVRHSPTTNAAAARSTLSKGGPGSLQIGVPRPHGLGSLVEPGRASGSPARRRSSARSRTASPSAATESWAPIVGHRLGGDKASRRRHAQRSRLWAGR